MEEDCGGTTETGKHQKRLLVAADCQAMEETSTGNKDIWRRILKRSRPDACCRATEEEEEEEEKKKKKKKEGGGEEGEEKEK